MKKFMYYLSILIYLATIINMTLTFFEIYINNTTIKVLYLSILLFLLFTLVIKHLKKQPVYSPTLKEINSMSIHEYLEPILPKKETTKPDEIKLLVMLTSLLSFSIFIWNMFQKPNGSPIIKEGKYFADNHAVLTAITQEEYYELFRTEQMVLTIFPLILATIGIWQFYQNKKVV